MTSGVTLAGRAALGAAALAVAVSVLASTFGTLGGRGERSGSATKAQPPVFVSAWADLPEAEPRFGLRSNLFGQEPYLYVIRRNLAGGGRLDLLTFGSIREGGAHLRLSIYRPLDEPVSGVSFWLEMARRAGEAGLAIERAPTIPEVVLTRLGPFEVGLLRAVSGDGSRECIGFRRQSSRPQIVLSGIACLGDGAADPLFAREAVVCAIEAIRLSEKDGDQELQVFFKGSAQSACGIGRPARAGG